MLETLLLAVYAVSAVGAGGHALLHKRDPHAAWGWIAACWLFPLAGALLYWLFGINRIESRALRIAGRPDPLGASGIEQPLEIPGASAIEVQELVRIGAAMTRRPLLRGNTIEPLAGGDTAYGAMLEGIAAARRSVHLSTYIYMDDAIGRRFALALAAAQARGVAVRVLLDGVADAWYRPPASRLLAAHGVRVARFLPPRLWPPLLHLNLRNHRKLLLIDGELGFAGGMNIADGHWQRKPRGAAIADMQFRIRGPLLHQLDEVFRGDWRLATGESIPAGDRNPPAGGPVAARAIIDGPNEEMDRLGMVLIGAMATAHERIWIMTPYFIPTLPLIAALQSAALRGVDVCVLLPEKSDQPWIDWATRHWLWQLLSRQVRVFVQPAPFAHTKLFIVDGYYAHFGSANMDIRSLRLNFELMIETYDPALNAKLAAHMDAARRASREISLRQVQQRRLPVRLRDAVCWLFSPYL